MGIAFKEFKADWSVNIEKFEYEGYAAMKNNIDQSKERITDGAFTKTLNERFPKNLIKAFWWHREPMGVPLQMIEDSKGLYTVTKVSKTPTNAERLILMQDGAVDKMSIGYEVIKDIMQGDGIRDLKELKMFEYSPVPIACNEETFITSVKSMQDMIGLLSFTNPNSVTKKIKADIDSAELIIDIKEGKVLSKANLNKIISARDTLQEIIDSMQSAEPETPPAKSFNEEKYEEFLKKMKEFREKISS